MKNILHFQVPMIGKDIFVKHKDLIDFMILIKNTVGEDYYVICSPCVPSMLSTESLINFDMKQINVKELINLIKESK